MNDRRAIISPKNIFVVL